MFPNKRVILVIFLIIFAYIPVGAADYYVSATRGQGRTGSLKKPAKDLGNIVSKLKPGDTVHIAGGVYLGRGKNGSDTIKVPVRILGGYDEVFKTRDPWGRYRTILSGENRSKNWVGAPRLLIDLQKYRGKEMPAIVVDGVIIDHGARNRYRTNAELEIVRMADPKRGLNPTPDRGGLAIRVSKTANFQGVWDITVRNCVIINTAPTQGVLHVAGYKGSRVTIVNNIVMNNTGVGIFAGTTYHPRDGKGLPLFTIMKNTVLFTWKYAASSQSFSGDSLLFDADTTSVVEENVFAYADRIGVNNAKKTSLFLYNNVISNNGVVAYLEFDTKIGLEYLADEAELLHENSIDNVSGDLKIPVDAAWFKLFDKRAKGVWLPRLSLDDAIQAGSKRYLDNGASRAF